MLSYFEYERISDGIRILGIKCELEDVVIPEGAVEIAEDAFCSAEIETVCFPNSLMRIGRNAFANCDFLRRVYFPKACRLREIGESAFRNTIITELKLPCELEKIGEYAFSGCEYLEVLDAPFESKHIEITDTAFLGCDALCMIYMPSGIKSLGGLEKYRKRIIFN